MNKVEVFNGSRIGYVGMCEWHLHGITGILLVDPSHFHRATPTRAGEGYLVPNFPLNKVEVFNGSHIGYVGKCEWHRSWHQAYIVGGPISLSSRNTNKGGGIINALQGIFGTEFSVEQAGMFNESGIGYVGMYKWHLALASRVSGW